VPLAEVATENFFPVSVFAAVTVTPGSGVFPACTTPVISNEVAWEGDGEPGLCVVTPRSGVAAAGD
jgi:hypothetical protein